MALYCAPFDLQVKARSLFPQLLLSFMRALPLETTRMTREPLLQSQCAALLHELDPASSPHTESACTLVRRLRDLFGRAGLFVQAVQVLLGDQIDNAEDEEGAFVLQELHEVRRTNRRVRASDAHIPDSFDLAEEEMLNEMERTLFGTQVADCCFSPC